MPNFGSSQNLISQNLSQTVDSQGNPIISSDTSFGASPLGYAARVQALFGLPNSTFELTPPDTTAVISAANPLPYWDVQDYSSGVMSGSAIYDSTTNSWGVLLNPGTAASGDYITMTTRSYLINDSNLGLRQQAFAIVSKNGTYAGTTQWNMELTATYYDTTDAVLHSGTVATIYDNTTWTSMAGTTTTSGTAISASANYVDLQFKLTATAAVTSATSVTIKSAILTTSTAVGKSLLVREAFTSSGTWTRPTGVDYLVAVVGLGAGGGGAGGQLTVRTSSLGTANGGGGGGGGAYAIIRDLYIGGVASVSVGIGAAGVGGTANTFSKPAFPNAGSAGTSAQDYVAGAAGGATTFGTFLTITGGNGASGGGGGGAAGTASSTIYDYSTSTAGAGASTPGAGGSVGIAGGTAAMAAFLQLSYLAAGTAAGGAGGNGTVTITGAGTSAVANGGAAGPIGYGGGGGSGGKSTQTQIAYVGGAGGVNGAGGGGGAASFTPLTTGGTVVITSGSGGTAAPSSGAGGGGGGACTVYGNAAPYALTLVTATSGKGGDGASGAIYVFYIA